MWRTALSCLLLAGALTAPAASQTRGKAPVFIVPNFHPASCGWLTDFSTERNYCANGYLSHLDRANADPQYAFAMSEVNNLMAVMAFQPQRVAELKKRIRERRAELANAFLLEPTINLSGGEALVKMGVEGLRWQQQVMGVRPRLAWMIDVTGVHEQMGQIVSGLGLDGMVYTRDNATGSALHWLQSPDGSRTLGISPGHYSDWSSVFSTSDRLSDADMRYLMQDAAAREKQTPTGAPILVLGGAGDYALPPVRREYPREFLEQWRQVSSRPIRFATPSAYLDAVLPGIRSGRIQIPTTKSGARHSWSSFWIEDPEVKQRYRRGEQSLQSAESLATVASLAANGTVPVHYQYPAQSLYEAWLQMLLNMDRNTLWGAARGSVFESGKSWDACDRFDAVEKTSARTEAGAMRSLLGTGKAVGFYNPLNWSRSDPVLVRLPAGKSLKGALCQTDQDGLTLCSLSLPSVGSEGVPLVARAPGPSKAVPLPATIDNAFYTAKVDGKTGALTSLKLKPSGREMLAGPIQVVAETGGDFHETPVRPKRKRLRGSGDYSAQLEARQGPLATVVEARSAFYGGGELHRTIRFYQNSPRIDFETEVEDIPGGTVVLAEFPLSRDIAEVRRGIPYGFSHGAWSRPNPKLSGFTAGIQPAIRWSHYTLAGGGGVALLDRGLPGRELTGRTPTLFLMNAQDNYMGYPCAWLSGKGSHRFSYALLAHEGDWRAARVPQRAWEFNTPPVVTEGVRQEAPKSFVRTSDNVILEALRRESGEIELRMAECFGVPGTAEVTVDLSHTRVERTDLVGGRRHSLGVGRSIRTSVRPQEIVTLRLSTGQSVPPVRPLRNWDSLVPTEKLASLRRYFPNRVGHPPLATDLQGTERPKLPIDARRSLTLCRPAEATEVYHSMLRYSAAMACDGDEDTRWATGEQVRQAALEVDLGKPRRICRAYISEAYDRVRSFELQSEKDGQWVTFARGDKIGANCEIEFAPVEASRIRLNILDAPGGPTIWEFMLFDAAGPKPLSYWVTSCLTNVFRDTARPTNSAARIDLVALRNESECAQIVLRPERPLTGVRAVAEPLEQIGGKSRIGAENIVCSFVGYLAVGKNSTAATPGELLRKAPADFPDPFLEEKTLDLKPGENQPLFVRVSVPKHAAPGRYRGAIRIHSDGGDVRVPIDLEVLPGVLPDRIPLYVTNWFSVDNLAKFHGVALWSEEFWRLLDTYAHEMARGHQNVVLTPLDLVQVWREPDGSLSFDYTRFDRWVRLFERAGVADRIELSHLGGRTTGEWECPTFSVSPRPATERATGKLVQIEIEQFLPDLERHLASEGWLEKSVLHIGDEPILGNVASWREQSERARRCAPRLKRIDAIHVPPEEVSSTLEVIVPQLNYFDQWITKFQAAQKQGKELWFYIAWVPQGKYTNRLIDLACIKTRLIHWINFRYGATGYLHWGLNFWTDFKDMGFAPGDNWILYPGKTGPRSCLRWEAMRDGLEDFAVFAALAKSNSGLAQKLAGEVMRSFTDYDQDPAHLERVRREALRALPAERTRVSSTRRGSE